jgi:hypothetical protein
MVSFRKVWRKSNFVQVGIEYTYGQTHMNIKGRPVEMQTPTHWNLIGHSMTAPHLRYRPAVFFRHLCHIALPFPQGKTRRVSKMIFYNISTF